MENAKKFNQTSRMKGIEMNPREKPNVDGEEKKRCDPKSSNRIAGLFFFIHFLPEASTNQKCTARPHRLLTCHQIPLLTPPPESVNFAGDA